MEVRWQLRRGVMTAADQRATEEPPTRDKAYRRYASGVEKALSLFETALEEWADYISFLNRLLKVRARRPSRLVRGRLF